jgi:flagellar assembly protein FliH
MQKSILKKSEILESVRPVIIKSFTEQGDTDSPQEFEPFMNFSPLTTNVANEVPATVVDKSALQPAPLTLNQDYQDNEPSLSDNIKKTMNIKTSESLLNDDILEDIDADAEENPNNQEIVNSDDFEQDLKDENEEPLSLNQIPSHEKSSPPPTIQEDSYEHNISSQEHQKLLDDIKIAEQTLENLNQQIEESTKKADEIIQKANQDADEIVKKADEKSSLEGQEQGILKGEEETKRLIKLLQTVTSQIVDEKNKILTSLEKDLVDLTLLIAGKVVKSITESYKRVVYDNVVAAIGKLKIKSDLIVKVSPDDLPTLEKYKSNLLQEINGIENLQFIEDPTIDKGGCVIISDFGSVDAKIASQLAEIEEQVRRVSPIKDF